MENAPKLTEDTNKNLCKERIQIFKIEFNGMAFTQKPKIPGVQLNTRLAMTPYLTLKLRRVYQTFRDSLLSN